MADVTRKKTRRLKRTVRKTLGALFLVSALVVAAIPTDNFSTQAAATESDWGTLDTNWSGAGNIPEVRSTDKIYTTGDGKFQFAYVYPKGASSGDRVAVILGYAGGQLLNNTLEIPNTVDAYAKLSDNLGTEGGRTAVGKSGNFLYYRVDTERFEQEPRTETDVSGNEVYVYDENNNQVFDTVKYIDTVYNPCYYEDRSKWQELSLDEFYYYPNATDSNPQNGDPALTSTSDVQRIMNAEVWYIGNQYLTAGTGTNEGTWTVGGTVNFANRDKGVFSGQSNIVTLLVGEKLSGIGDYAFYDCANLTSITLNNGLNTIGVGAFANCINMSEVNIDQHSYVSVIGDYAFYNCQALSTFTVPNSVRTLGNSVFEDCFAITEIEISGKGENVLLSNLGTNVFRGCEHLQSLTFPRQFTQSVDISTFEGCRSLKYIATPDNNTINFVEGTIIGNSFTFSDFKATVPGTFYFQGVKDSAVHRTATEKEVAFSFFDTDINKDVYELTVTEEGKKVVYRVDSDDNLVYCNMETGMETVTLPATIGPNKIRIIDSNTFQGNHYLTKITIPASINEIAPNAFRGCHNLKYVLFTNPSALTSIGSGAFKTQDGVTHNSTTNCSHTGMSNTPELYFVGPVSYSSTPFEYAMNPNEYINNGSQERSYITYYSGWPTHLEIRYNEDTDKNELIDYPTFASIAGTGSAGAKYTTAKYPYMTDEHISNMTTAVGKYINNEQMTDYEREIINAALNLILPEGIESVKEGLYIENEASETRPDLQKTITAYSLKEVEDGAFQGCRFLTGVTLSDATEKIGNYAFEDCANLSSVNLPGTVREMGIRPFKDCPKLNTVNFSGGPYFTCENSIIYELDDSGAKEKIVECLEGRTNPYVTSTETNGVKELYQEAFMETTLVNVDLSSSSITSVPEYAFAYTPSLTQVTLPKTIRNIRDNAFKNSNVVILKIPGQYQNITTQAFGDGIYDASGDCHTAGNAGDATDLSRLTIFCEEGSMAEDYAKTNNIAYSNEEPDNEFTVSFYDKDSKLIETVTVKQGGAATPPTPPEVEGYTFTGWQPTTYLCVTENIPYVQAQYEKKDVVLVEHTVTFVDDDENNTVLSTQKVKDGGDAVIPQSPSKEGYVFKGWKGKVTNITRDETVYAYYEKVNSGSGNGGSDNGSGSNGGGSGNGSNTGSGNTSGTLYTLTVKNGSGSGSYAEGSQPVIIANDPATGQEFSHWTISPSDTKIASTALSASVITMPAANVTVTAHYKAKSGVSTGTGNTSNSNSNRPNSGGGTVISGGTTVVIDKNGLSNTGVVSATVKGSSDNFTIKISENSSATEAVLRALVNEYGNDLSSIKYFPMDISLYDSTGNNKIYDTTGLSISITLPLPDSLITYAGNNKVAGVVNDRLDKLSPKFTTIDGVSCVTFTAEHFSPYVIYVDTSRLSEGTVADSTPKTGDGIHPKWFLSIGLACLSFVMFMQKDGRKKQKIRVKANG